MSGAAVAVDLKSIAAGVIDLAKRAGATGAECNISEGEEFSVNVRLGEVEELTDAGSRSAGVRVLVGQRVGSAYTSDLSSEGLQAMVAQAMDVARITSEDPFAGLPDVADLGVIEKDLGLYSDSVAAASTEWKIEQARKAEAVALGRDPRIVNSEGASFGTHLSHGVFANSLDYLQEYRASSCSTGVVPLAKEGGSMERDYWYSAARAISGLEEPEQIGRIAADRALRRLNPRKVATQKVPIVFEPRVARSLLSSLFDAVNGESIYRGESFLAGKLGEKIAVERLTVIDDGTIPGLLGSSPFDDEGVPPRRTVLIEQGVLQSYLLNTYTAKKLGMKTTGSATRGLTGNAGVGHNNLFAEPGGQSPEEIIRSIQNGFYVTDLMGFGVNIVTGDYSRGAVGLWIENGELTYAVSEVTIASTLQEMLQGIEALANDLEFRGAVACPTLLIREMTVSGQ